MQEVAGPGQQSSTDRKPIVFISYSRKDLTPATRLKEALERLGVDVRIDLEDLPYLEKFQGEIADMIRTADAVLCLLSPRSIDAKWVKWELEQSIKLNKRLAPIVIDELPVGSVVMPELQEINFLSLTPPNDFDEQVAKLVMWLGSDLQWVKEHTRLGALASRWDAAQRPWGLLLRHREIDPAERWLMTRPREAPLPTDAQIDFIRASRGAVGMLRNVVIAAVALIAVIMGVLAVVADTARVNTKIAQSSLLGDRASNVSDEGDGVTAMLLGIEALQVAYTPEAERGLYSGHFARRELHVLTGHSQSVHSVAFDHTGTRLLTASSDGTARLFDVESGAQLHVLQHGDGLLGAQFNSTSGIILTFGGTTARLWNTQTGQAHGADVTAASSILHASFNTDGSQLGTAMADGTAQVWNTATREKIAILRGHEGPVVRIVFARSGRVLTASADRTARLWDLTNNASVPLKGPRRVLKDAMFSPDEEWIATVSAEWQLFLWTRDGQLHNEPINKDNKSIGDNVLAAAFSPDGKSIAAASEDKSITVWDVATSKRRVEIARMLHSHWATGVAFSPDGKRLLTASTDNTARVWDAQTGTLLLTFAGHQNHRNRGLVAAFSPNAKYVATGSWDGTARIWRADSDINSVALKGHSGNVWGASFSPDGALVATASIDGVRLWSARTGEHRRLNRPAGSVRHLSTQTQVWTAHFHPTEPILVTASRDRSVRFWSTETGLEVRPSVTHDAQVRDAVFSSKGTLVVTASFDGLSKIVNAQTGAIEGQPIDVHAASDCSRVSTQSECKYVMSATFSPDLRRVLIASRDGAARLWDVSRLTAPPVEIRHTDGPNQRAGIMRYAAFSPDGAYVVTASADRTAQIWDASAQPAPKNVAVMSGHTLPLWTAAFSADGKRIVTASEDATARLWSFRSAGNGSAADVTSIAILKGHTMHVRTAALNRDGTQVVTASSDGTGRLWAIFPTAGDLMRHAKSAVPRCLTPEQRSQFHLPPEPPIWCITGPEHEDHQDPSKWTGKWPYHCVEWRAWLEAQRTKRGAPTPRCHG